MSDNHNNLLVYAGEMMPDGKGGWMPVPAVMDKDTAARYLCCQTSTIDRAMKKHGLVCTHIGNSGKFLLEELKRFAKRRTKRLKV